MQAKRYTINFLDKYKFILVKTTIIKIKEKLSVQISKIYKYIPYS